MYSVYILAPAPRALRSFRSPRSSGAAILSRALPTQARTLYVSLPCHCTEDAPGNPGHPGSDRPAVLLSASPQHVLLAALIASSNDGGEDVVSAEWQPPQFQPQRCKPRQLRPRQWRPQQWKPRRWQPRQWHPTRRARLAVSRSLQRAAADLRPALPAGSRPPPSPAAGAAALPHSPGADGCRHVPRARDLVGADSNVGRSRAGARH